MGNVLGNFNLPFTTSEVLAGARAVSGGSGQPNTSLPPPPPPGPPAGGLLASAYDGLNDFADVASLTGQADTKELMVSFWARYTGLDSTVIRLIGEKSEPNDSTGVAYVTRQSNNKYSFLGGSATNVTIARMQSDLAVYNVAFGWHHVIFAMDLVAGLIQLYINGVNQTDTVNEIATNEFMNTDHPSHVWFTGAEPTGSDKLDGELSEVYWTHEFLDLTVADNLAKFFSDINNPIGFGADGSGPTGNQPLLYFPDGNPADNKGSGGNMAITGVLASVDGPGV